jgi:hypothetical protein
MENITGLMIRAAVHSCNFFMRAYSVCNPAGNQPAFFMSEGVAFGRGKLTNGQIVCIKEYGEKTVLPL